jgi:hypothetical protein
LKRVARRPLQGRIHSHTGRSRRARSRRPRRCRRAGSFEILASPRATK